MNKKLLLLLIVTGLMAAIVAFFSLTPGGTQTLWQISRGGNWLLPLVIVASLIDSLNPCAFSILFLTIAFLFSLGRSKTDIFKIGSVYILGIFVVYIFIGLGILQTLHLFNTPNFMGKIGALILLIWGGLNLINHFFPKFPIKLKIPSFAHGRIAQLMHQATLPAAFVLGVIVGLCEFPCTGGPYLMILGLLHDQATRISGFGYLLLYNLIFVSPLVVILGLASNPALHDRVKSWRKLHASQAELIGSLVMLFIGLLILLL